MGHCLSSTRSATPRSVIVETLFLSFRKYSIGTYIIADGKKNGIPYFKNYFACVEHNAKMSHKERFQEWRTVGTGRIHWNAWR